MLFWGTERPDTFLDIAETLGQKIQSIKAHQSQMEGRSEAEIMEFLKGRARDAGQENGHECAASAPTASGDA